MKLIKRRQFLRNSLYASLMMSARASVIGVPVKASRVWSGLPQGFLDNLTCFWHQTGTNAHPEFPAVRRLMGALRDDESRNNEEELASAIAMETAASLGTTTNKPILLSGQGSFKGSPLSR